MKNVECRMQKDIGHSRPRQLYERADHLNAHVNCLRAIEDIGSHNGPMLGEGAGEILDILPALQGRNLRP